jgi:phosphatidyl-myo-inositol dimannoside synthase
MQRGHWKCGPSANLPRMRILVLCTEAYGGHGGIAVYNRDLIEALAEHPRCSEVVVLPRIVRSDTGTFNPKVRFMAQAAEGRAAYVRSVVRLLPQRRSFDLVVCGHINLLAFARLFSKRPLLFLYGIEAWKPDRRNRAGSFRDCLGVVSISRVTLDRFLGWSSYQGPGFLLPNAVHRDEMAGARDTRILERLGVGDRRVLLTLGRLERAERYKGFDEVMEILPNLPGDVLYVIAGDGNDQQRLERKAAELAVSDRVIFTGRVTEEEKRALYARADIYVMPSRGEGFGFVFLEALACGTPVIASATDGGRDAVRDGMLGRLVDPANPDELRSAVVELLENRSARIVPDGVEYFDFSNFVERLHDLIARLLPTQA